VFTNGQRVERHQVEHWIAQAYPHMPFFRAVVTEAEEPEKRRIRVTITITGNNGEQIVHPFDGNRLPRYYAFKSAGASLPQIESCV